MPELPQTNPPSRGWKIFKGMVGILAAFIAWFIYYSGTSPAPPVPKPTGDGKVAERNLPPDSPVPPKEPKEIAKNTAENLKLLRFKANETIMVSSLRTLNTALLTYSVDHSGAYPPSMAALGQAGLIDAALASGNKAGYIYTYKSGQTLLGISWYSVWARPEIYNRTSAQSCVTNQSSTIHCTYENRYATLSDPIIQ